MRFPEHIVDDSDGFALEVVVVREASYELRADVTCSTGQD